MNRLLLSSAFLAAFSLPSAAAVLNADVFDNGVLVGSATSISGSFTLDVSDPNFDTLIVSGAGVPDLPNADLSTVTLNVTSGAIHTLHQLEIDVFQTGVNAKGLTASTFTANDLIGDPGPTVEKTFVGGSFNTLGTLVKMGSFPAGTVAGSLGPLFSLQGPFTADAQQYLVNFNAPDQSSNDTIEFRTAIPEPATWAMLAIGFAFIGWTAIRRQPDRLTSRYLFGGKHGAE